MSFARRRRTIRVRSVVGAVVVAGMLGATAASGAPASADPPATQRVGGYTVRWPAPASLDAMRPGASVRLSLTRSAGAAGRVAEVSLLHVARSGRPLALVAKRRVRRRGTFVARLPSAAGRYALRVKVGRSRRSRSFAVAPPAPAVTPALPPVVAPPATPDPFVPCGGNRAVQGTLSVTPGEARPGQSLQVTLSNTGSTCLYSHYGVRWEIYRDGAWAPGPVQGAAGALRILRPGDEFVDRFISVPQEAAPGRYRMTKEISGDDATRGPLDPASWIDVATEITAIP